MRVRYKNGLVRNLPKIRARALIRTGAAQPADGTYQTRDMHAAPPAPQIQDDDIKQLRADYQEVYGKRPFPGWDAATLRQKIDEALNA